MVVDIVFAVLCGTSAAVVGHLRLCGCRRRVAAVYFEGLGFFGTKARNRLELLTRILCSVSSLTPALRNFGTQTVSALSIPGPPFCFQLDPASLPKSAEKRRFASYPASSSFITIGMFRSSLLAP